MKGRIAFPSTDFVIISFSMVPGVPCPEAGEEELLQRKQSHSVGVYAED